MLLRGAAAWLASSGPLALIPLFFQPSDDPAHLGQQQLNGGGRGHASPKTTKLYDRTADTITVDEIERIVI